MIVDAVTGPTGWSPMPDARDIVDELTAGGVRLNIGGSLHDPTDPVGRLLFTGSGNIS